MCFFRKKKATQQQEKELNDRSRDIAAEIRTGLEKALLVINDDEAKKILEAMHDELLYLPPSPRPEVYAIDEKIRNSISDIRRLANGDKPKIKEINEAIMEIKSLLLDRKLAYQKYTTGRK